MAKILIYSDLHTEFADFVVPEVDAELVVLAGDIGVGTAGVEWARNAFGDRPVVYVPGNHEYYGGHIIETMRAMRSAAEGSQVHVLDRDEIELAGLRILGAVLWTDFELLGRERRAEAMAEAGRRLNDYHQIAGEHGLLRPQDTAAYFQRDSSWLRARLRRDDRPTLAVTHHAPSLSSAPDMYRASILAPAFVSNLEALMRSCGPRLWVHGHTHHGVDYQIGPTRVVSNQRGYPHEPVAGFDREFVVEL